jgi:hypothetical protein
MKINPVFVKSLALLILTLLLHGCERDDRNRVPKNHFLTCENAEELNLKRVIKNIPDDTLLSIQTYENSNQPTHPDILTGENCIYMVLTPYPYYDDKVENPCLYASRDGLAFHSYRKNPLVKKPEYGYNCDPDMFYDSNHNICIYYLQTMRPDSNNLILLKRNKTKGEFLKKEILNYQLDKGDAFIVSPSLIKKTETDRYHLFYVNKSEKPNTIEYLKTDSLHQWSKTDNKKISIEHPDDYNPWHIDVIKGRSKYYMLINGYYGGFHENDFSLILTESTNLTDWRSRGTMLPEIKYA